MIQINKDNQPVKRDWYPQRPVPGRIKPIQATEELWLNLWAIKDEYDQLLAQQRTSDGQYITLSSADEAAKLRLAIGNLSADIRKQTIEEYNAS